MIFNPGIHSVPPERALSLYHNLDLSDHYPIMLHPGDCFTILSGIAEILVHTEGKIETVQEGVEIGTPISTESLYALTSGLIDIGLTRLQSDKI